MTPNKAIAELIQEVCIDMPVETAQIVADIALHAYNEALSAITRITGNAHPEYGGLALITAMQMLRATIDNEIEESLRTTR